MNKFTIVYISCIFLMVTLTSCFSSTSTINTTNQNITPKEQLEQTDNYIPWWKEK